MELSLIQAKQAQFSEPFLVGEMLQPSDHLSGPPLEPLQELHILPVVGVPDLDAVLQMGPHKSRVEGYYHLPLTAGLSFFNAAQDTVGLPGCKRTLLAHVQLLVHQDPKVLLCRAALKEIFIELQNGLG